MDEERKAQNKAKEEMDNWKKQREIKINAKMESNREEEKIVVEGVAAGIESGQTWDRVMKLIDASAEPQDSGKSDVGRMKKLFIQLKNDKPAA